MARITVEDCLEKVENQYDLVLLAKERTVQLNAGSPMQVEEDNDKRTIISLREIGDNKIDVKEIEAQLKLNKLPKNSSKIRIRNRCEISGRPHGVYRKLKISRIALRDMASSGKIPGITKSSW